MPVLKAQHAPSAMTEAIVLDLGDLGAQAAKIRMDAQAKAEQIIADAYAVAKEDASQKFAQAAEQGFNQGLKEGTAQGLEQGKQQALEQMSEKLGVLQAAWSEVAGQWEQQRVEMEREARQAVLEFALRTAEKVVHRVIEVDPSVVVDQVGAALDRVLAAHDASVQIHPTDRAIVEQALPELLTELAGLKHVTLVEDDNVAAGGCIVSFGGGQIDATLERQLERIVNLILPAPELPEAQLSQAQPPAVSAQPSPSESNRSQVDEPPLADVNEAQASAGEPQAAPEVTESEDPPPAVASDEGVDTQ